MKTKDSVSECSLPQIAFWDGNAPQVQFINSDDFRRRELLEQLGIQGRLNFSKSFGTYDAVEIERRQRVMKMFLDHPQIRDELHYADLTECCVPKEEMGFLQAFPENREHNPFWAMVLEVVTKMRDAYREHPESCPPEVSQFCGAIESVRPQAEETERTFATKVAEEILKSAELFGSVTVKHQRLDWEIDQSNGGGYQLYSYLLADWREWELPKWADNKICRATGLRKAMQLAVSFLNCLHGRHRYDACVIREVPQPIQRAICDYVKAVFYKAPRSGGDYSTEWITISFSYNGNGLRLWLSGVSGDFSGATRQDDPRFRNISDFDGFSITERRRLRKIFTRAREFFVSESAHLAFKSKFWAFTKEQQPELLQPDGYALTDSIVDSQFKWYSVRALCETSCAAEYQAVLKTREVIQGWLSQLQQMAKVADSLARLSAKWELPLCFPQILGDGTHLVSFDALAPIHLIGKISKEEPLIPVGPICLNGQTLGFIGQNAGGKTVAKETIIMMLYMALSGLPVFGKNVRLNPKKAVGLMFLERGDGSTFQLQLRKARLLLEAAQKIEPAAMVLFLDEVGTGAPQSVGFDFGKRLLLSLGKSKPSIVFSTQMLELAQFAEDNGAVCYTFNLDHEVSRGIGASDAEELIRREGLEELLTEV